MDINKSDIQIIPASLQHLKEIQKLNKMLFEKEYREYDKRLNLEWTFGEVGTAYYKKRISEKDGCVIVALVDKKIVGYLCGGIAKSYAYRKLPKVAELENMFVLEKYRSYGIGTVLYKAFILWCKTQKVKMVNVHTSAKNTRAIAFYRKQGLKDYTLVLESEI